MAWVRRAADTNNSPSFSVMLSMIDAAQVLTYDNVTSPGSFSDMVSHTRNRSSAHWQTPHGQAVAIVRT